MNIIDHPALAGSLKHVAATSGGEFAGPCPWCGGEDRFRIWPDHPSHAAGGKYLCRRCGRSGDGIQFLRDLEGLAYAEACRRLEVPPKKASQAKWPATPPSKWEPKAVILPGEAWGAKAGEFVAQCHDAMAGPGFEYATSRGLSAKTAVALKIGWNPTTVFDSREAWGLPPEVNERTGKPRLVWLPAGLIIPTRRDGIVTAIKIRRAEWRKGDEFPKYVQVAGSGKASMVLAPGEGKPCVVVESELDAILAAQEGRDVVTAVAMLTAQGRPDAETHALLKAAPLILVALDFDEAGAKGWPWWQGHYLQAVRWPVHVGKDVGDLAATPGRVRAWIRAGLPGETKESLSAHTDVAGTPSVAETPKKQRRLHPVEGLSRGEFRPYSAAQLSAFAVSHPGLVCCPATLNPWNWREKLWCSRCETPCEIGVNHAA
jgi:DNA primase